MSHFCKRGQHPTCVSLVNDFLKARSDFTSTAMLVRATGCQRSTIMVALWHLRKHRAVDVVIERDGTGWWFATPTTDTRLFQRPHRAEETKGRKPAKHRRRKTDPQSQNAL